MLCEISNQPNFDAQRFDILKKTKVPLVKDSYPKVNQVRLDVMDTQRFDLSKRKVSSSGRVTPAPSAEERVSFLDMDSGSCVQAQSSYNNPKPNSPESAVELHERLDIKALTRRLEDIRLETMNLQRFDISRRQSPSSSEPASGPTSSTSLGQDGDPSRVCSSYTTDTVFWNWMRSAHEDTQPKTDTKFWDWIKTLRGDVASPAQSAEINTSEVVNGCDETPEETCPSPDEASVATQPNDEVSTLPSSTEISASQPAPVVIYSDADIRIIEHFDRGTYVSTRTVIRSRKARSKDDIPGSPLSRPTSPLRKLVSLNCTKQKDIFFEEAMRLERELRKKRAAEEGVTVWVTQPIRQEELRPEWRDAIRALYFQNNIEETRGINSVVSGQSESGSESETSATAA
ncbi:hypothetical protein K435DRAFT_789149 [Dendrothele bispora CBS 962.96]|uniref:Uncharacterized protein n=1 Tax=Dendrothele bispora (strain CBS 962.96) TaxID=1314807 RepID=A0A4V4HIH7_DENBC|nr:hypothetical protein K435DRAFT_789149 [Dendrothele bispora CBS 962.96]